MYLLQGDICQMATQKEELSRKDIKFEQLDVYPAIEKEVDYIRALNIILTEEIEGWWNYKEDFIKYKICTEDQFKMKFKE